jgi:hypothetical protein
MIRALGVKVDSLTQAITNLSTTLGGYVTQERYEADRRLSELQHTQLAESVKADRVKAEGNRRLALSAFIAPLIVGLVIWYLTKGGS